MEAQDVKYPILDKKWYIVKDEIGGISIANVNKPVEEFNFVDEIIFINCRFKYVAHHIIELHNKNLEDRQKYNDLPNM